MKKFNSPHTYTTYKNKYILIFLLFALLLFLSFTGCGSSSSSSSSSDEVANISGVWKFEQTTTYDNTDPTGTKSTTTTIKQSGNQVNFDIYEWTYTGTVTANSISLKNSMGTETGQGSISNNATYMSGTFSGKNGDAEWGGTWIANKVE